MYFYGEEYVKFLGDLRRFCNCDLRIIRAEESRHYEWLKAQNNAHAPIALLDGEVEVVMLHFRSNEEVVEKWKRRAERICWDNLIVKFSEQNYTTEAHLRKVDEMAYEKKIIFTSHDYGLKSQVLFKEYEGCPQIPNEVTYFRRYVDLEKLINGKSFKKRQ